MSKVRGLTLHKGRFEKTRLYKVKKGWKIIFKLAPEFLAESNISLHTNYPADGAEFRREKYQNVNIKDGKSELTVSRAGSYHYYVASEDKEPLCDGYISVDPVLARGLELDGLMCQTVLAKLLGPLDTWRDKLEVAYRTGFNMIHFTPVQRLGNSNSAYSLSDQLQLNVAFSPPGGDAVTHDDVKQIVSSVRDEWGLISICDIVLNHTANETPWLAEHPEATYNLVNSPHLRPAFILDRVVKRLARDIGEGIWVDREIPKGEISTVEHIEICKDLLLNHYLPQVNIPQLFLPDVSNLAIKLEERMKESPLGTSSEPPGGVLKIIQDPEYRRLTSSVDLDLALRKYNRPVVSAKTEEDRVSSCVASFRRDLECLASALEAEVVAHLKAAVDNLAAGATYQHVDPEGPRNICVSVREDQELTAPYFTCPDLATLEEEAALCWTQAGAHCMAHNGWVMGDDPLRNFALPGSGPANVYLRRELVAWGDSVKLRYGDRPDDSPFLWDYMRQYVESVVEIFDGVRLDNCHSTPLHVASWLLDQARQVRPDLYVCAELFTGSEEKDNVFVNTLGITSLIREGMAAWDSHELGRMVYKYGGATVGSFSPAPGEEPELRPATAHALLYDWTHDNPSPAQRRSVQDMLPSGGLVAMAACGAGSSRGYDELVPHHIHVVQEQRQYRGWSGLSPDLAMLEARRELGALHARLAREGFSEVFVDQKSRDVVAVTRHCPATRRSVIMVAHTHFFPGNTTPTTGIEVFIEGQLKEILLEAKMEPVGDIDKEFEKCKDVINGVDNWKAVVSRGGQGGLMKVMNDGSDSNGVRLNIDDLTVGSLFIIEVWPQPSHSEAIERLSDLDTKSLSEAVSGLSLLDVQSVLFQCSGEGGGCYNVPGHGDLNYCGLAGLVPVLAQVRRDNELGHPLAANLRAGDWLLDYILSRLSTLPAAAQLHSWLTSVFSSLKCLPRYLIPQYFDTCVMHVYQAVLARSFSLMSPFISGGSEFIKLLSLGSIIHTACSPSAPLPPLSSDLSPPPTSPTLAAGLPHFSTGYMRSWGRDTFISLRGLLLVTGRFPEARDIILGYAATLRHGLIPNLLDGGRNARYNCRDAVWWWLQAVMDYITISEDEGQILQSPVIRLYPSDEAEYTTEVSQPLHEVIHEALVTHLNGLKFRERNAGKKIDEHMTDAGFDNTIGVDPNTGFVFGGNIHNCGTWMDKMGSSGEAGNKGVPSTPRDGSAVEIVGLSWSVVSALSQLGPEVYSHQDIPVFGSLAAWADTIKENFDNHFWIGSKAGAQIESNPQYVNRTGLYKDSVGSGQGWTDYQLRPNQVISLALAQDILHPEHVRVALDTLVTRLLGPLGLATLDPEDWAYRGDYDNSDQSRDKTVAHGANYHQGPEWVWPVGFLMRAMLRLASKLPGPEAERLRSQVRAILARLYSHLATSAWLGLPELTNRAGRECRDSNPVQAWSLATVLDTLYDMDSLGVKLES